MSTSVRPPSVVGSSIRYWWVVAACIAVGAAGAFAFSVTQDVQVPARGRIVLTDMRLPTFDTGDITRAASQRAAEEATLASSRAVFEAAATTAGATYDEVRSTVKVAVDADATNTLTVDGRASTLAASTSRVNAVIAAYQAAALEKYSPVFATVVEQLEADISSMQAQLAELQNRFASTPADDPLRSDLQREISLLQSTISTRNQRLTSVTNAQASFDGGVSLAGTTDTASGATEPNKRRNVAFGAGLGLLIGVGGAWSLADRRQAARTAAASSVTVPVVEFTVSRRASTENVAVPPGGVGAGRAALALATLAARRHEADVREGVVIAVTDENGSARAVDTALSLAQIAADDGARVLLVNGRGTPIARGGNPSAGSPVSLTTPTGATFELVQIPTTRNLRDELATPEHLARLQAARRQFSTVLTLLPALTDSGAIAGLRAADATLLVTLPDATVDPQLSAVLEAAGAPLAAVVVARSRSRR